MTAALLWAVSRIACFGALLATGVHKRRVLAGVMAQAEMRATPTSPTQAGQFGQLTLIGANGKRLTYRLPDGKAQGAQA